MILPKVPDPRLTTIRRGGTLTDEHHHLLALWAATCAEHVLHLCEAERPDDPRPREAIDAIRAWTRGELRMMETRAYGGHAMAAARPLTGAPLRRVRRRPSRLRRPRPRPRPRRRGVRDQGSGGNAPRERAEAVRVAERSRQCEVLPDSVLDLVLDDQQHRNDLCWSVFAD